MRRQLSTAKTTLLPANYSLGTKKGLHSTARLDDTQGQAVKFAHWQERPVFPARADIRFTSEKCQIGTFIKLQ
jgi:hypothetical protein